METAAGKSAWNVLIVDDTRFMREILRKILEGGGFRVVAEAADGIDAIAKYRATRPHLTIMDVIMPKKNGIEATREIVSQDADARVVMCSVVQHEALVEAAQEAGAKGVIIKPFVANAVLETLQGVLRG